MTHRSPGAWLLTGLCQGCAHRQQALGARGDSLVPSLWAAQKRWTDSSALQATPRPQHSAHSPARLASMAVRSPRAADLQEAPPHPAREARRDGDCGQVLTAPPRRPSSLQVSCTPLPNVSPSLRAHDLSYFLPSFTPEPEPEKSSPGQPATPNSPGGRTPSLLGS